MSIPETINLYFKLYGIVYISEPDYTDRSYLLKRVHDDVLISVNPMLNPVSTKNLQCFSSLHVDSITFKRVVAQYIDLDLVQFICENFYMSEVPNDSL